LERAGAGTTGAFLPPRLFVGAGDFADIFGIGGAAALRGVVRGDNVVHSLRAFAAFYQRELHFQFALVFPFDVLDGNFHFLFVKSLNG